MYLKTRSFLAAGLLVLSAGTLRAQSLATFGSAELAGFGEGSALLGTSWSQGHQGWGPVVDLVGQTYRYSNGNNSHAQAYSISPSVGLVNTMPEGSVQGMVGYSFVNTTFPNIIAGNQTGSTNGAFVSAQGNYWGTGENSAQAIGSYGFKDEYYWTRFRAAHRLAPATQPIYVGGEVVLQGSQKAIPSQFRYQVGPTIEYRLSPEFRVGASTGYRGGNNSFSGTGYARIEFLLLTKLN